MHVSNGVRSNVLKECRVANAQGIQTLLFKAYACKSASSES